MQPFASVSNREANGPVRPTADLGLPMTLPRGWRAYKRLRATHSHAVWLGVTATGQMVALKHYPQASDAFGVERDCYMAFGGVVAPRLLHADSSRRILGIEWQDGHVLASFSDFSDGLSMLRATARSVAMVHKAGVEHGDLKPSNIKLGGTRESPKAWLIDFGLARRFGEQALGRGRPSAAYGAPERLAGATVGAAAADVYALGCLGLRLLGAPWPPAGAARHVLEKRAADPALLRRLTRDLRASAPIRLCLHACLADDPNDRPGDARVVYRALS